MQNRKTIVIAVILMVTLCLAGCPAGDKWQKAATASKGLIETVDKAQDTEIEFYNRAIVVVTPEEHSRVQNGFKKLAQVDKSLNAAILAGSSAKDATAAFQAALDATDGALNDGTFTVKDPAVNASIHGAILATKVILENIRTIATK